MNEMKKLIFVFLLINIVLSSNVSASDSLQVVNVGVLARRGSDECLQEWSLTAKYLSSRIPGYVFKIIPLKFDEVVGAVEKKDIDFVIVTSSKYIELQNLFGISRMATIKRSFLDGYATLFGGVIFCRADRDDINTLEDLKGKSFMAVDPTSFGGWLASWRELKVHGIDPQKDFAQFSYSGTHDSVAYAVRDGKVDGGTVATPILEKMIDEGKIAPNTFKVINKQEREDFPYLLSTRLYPEWPFAKLKHTPNALAEKVAVALLSMPAQGPAAQAAQSVGWTVPLDYEPVDACMKELRVGIYKDFGSVSFPQLLVLYRWQVIVLVTVLIILSGLLLFSVRLNRRLKLSDLTLHQEVRQRKQVHDELVESHEFLQQSRQQLTNIIDFLPDATFVIDNDKRVIFWNKAMEEMSGVPKESILGQGDYAYTVPFYGEKRKQLLDLLDVSDQDLAGKYFYIRKKRQTLYAEAFAPALNKGQGAYFWATAAPLYDLHGQRIGAIESIRDISEQKQAENEREKLKSRLAQTQKLEAVGTLAGGIAHDFNNILTAIIGYTDMARHAPPSERALATYLDQIFKAGNRAKDLVRQILTFSRQTKIELIPLDPARIVREATQLLRPTLPSTISINQQIAPDTKPILADPTQIHQIVVNLCTNAFHAMEQTGGILSISLKNHVVSREELDVHPEMQSGSFVQLSVSDSGAGISAEIQEKIFDPYFTTKETGKGSGMGLAVVHGIVQNYGGFIQCASEPENGTAFHIYFPAIDDQAAPGQMPVIETIPSGSERILFVDDEELLVEMSRAMLKNLGYLVTVTTSSEEALTLFQNHPDQFDVVVTDQTMPGMTGMELAQQLLGIRPDIPIILCTGYSPLVSDDQVRDSGIKEFAMKPLDMKDIATLLRKVLDEGKTPV